MLTCEHCGCLIDYDAAKSCEHGCIAVLCSDAACQLNHQHVFVPEDD